MKKILLMSLLLHALLARAQETLIQKQINSISLDQFIKQPVFISKSMVAATGELKNYMTCYDLLDGNNQAVNRILNEKPASVEIPIQMDGKPVTLLLVRNNDLSDQDMLFKIGNGELVKGEKHACYYGVIKNQLNSFVVMSFFRNNIIGILSNSRGNYSIAKKEPKNPKVSEYIVFLDKNLLIKKDFSCGTDKLPDPIQPGSTPSLTGTPAKFVSLYLEIDHPLYQRLGSVPNADKYGIAMRDALVIIFQNESIKVTVMSPIVIRSTGDTYGSPTVISVLANSFRIAIGAFGGDLAHLLSGRTGLDHTGFGPGAYCSTDKTSVSTNMGKLVYAPLFIPISSEIALAAHEIGHTMGSPHTQSCYWNLVSATGTATPIDGCGTLEGCSSGVINPGYPPTGGTIMSYCDAQGLEGIGINLSNGFGIQPGNQIRIHTNNASCLNTYNATCNSDVTITGKYYITPLTESSTWIKTSGTTTILGGIVKLDVDTTSYIELNPGFEAASLNSSAYNSIFIAKASNGCTTGAPSFTSKVVNYGGDVTKRQYVKKKTSFSIYPNPATDYFTIVSDVDISNVAIEVFDMSGKLQIITIKNTDKRSKKILVKNLSKGMYIVKLATAEKSEFAKIIIQ